VIAAVGCSSGPTIDPDEFARLIATLEATTGEVIGAFEAGNPSDADRPLHDVSRALASVERFAPTLGLDATQTAAVAEGVEGLAKGFEMLHEPMHKAEFPKDFDFAPAKASIEQGLAKLRGGLPLGIVSKVDELNALAQPAAAPAPPEVPPAEIAPIDIPASGDPLMTAPATPDATPPTAPELPTPPAPDFPAGPALGAPAPPDPAASGGGPRAAPFRLVSSANQTVRPVCPTVMMYDRKSIDLAPERVNRAATELVKPGIAPADRWVQLVPTVHGRLNGDLTIAAYGMQGDRGVSWSSSENFTTAEQVTDETGSPTGLADRYRDAFAAAIGQAVRRGLHVAILPHVDPAGGPVEEWRNLWDFAPERVIGLGSYRTLLLDPLADAIEAECTSDTRIDFALSGEMGRSLFTHPSEYMAILRGYRERFESNPRTRGVRLGIALNHSGITGEVPRARIDRNAIREFFAECDFIGYSCYSPVSVPPTPDDFRRSVERFLDELRGMGVDVPPDTPLVFSEIGLGGGVAPGPAGGGSSLEEIAREPWVGRGHGGGEAWGTPERRRLRGDYFDAACRFLAEQTGPGPVVERAFVWSEGPWDPQGITGPRFRDDAIAEAIARHNAGD
jgi:hypothetical protein